MKNTYDVKSINEINDSFQESFCESLCPLRVSGVNDAGYPYEDCKCGWDNCPVKEFLKYSEREWNDTEKPHCYTYKYFKMGETLAGYDMMVCDHYNKRVRDSNDSCSCYEEIGD